MRYKVPAFLATLSVLVGVSTGGALSLDGAASTQPRKEKVVIQAGAGVEHVFHVEVALTQGEILRGLTFRTSLPADEGMLFVFPESSERSFWMRNTLLPLDL